jgi:hypothetical protein
MQEEERCDRYYIPDFFKKLGSWVFCLLINFLAILAGRSQFLVLILVRGSLA